jgi:hypothetical protein
MTNAYRWVQSKLKSGVVGWPGTITVVELAGIFPRAVFEFSILCYVLLDMFSAQVQHI